MSFGAPPTPPPVVMPQAPTPAPQLQPATQKPQRKAMQPTVLGALEPQGTQAQPRTLLGGSSG